MDKKERADYRRVLNEAQNEFETLYRGNGGFSYSVVRKLFFRIGEVLAKHDRIHAGKADREYFKRKDIRTLLK